MSPFTSLAYERSFIISLPSWVGWAAIAVATLFILGLTVLLLVVARRGRSAR